MSKDNETPKIERGWRWQCLIRLQCQRKARPRTWRNGIDYDPSIDNNPTCIRWDTVPPRGSHDNVWQGQDIEGDDVEWSQYFKEMPKRQDVKMSRKARPWASNSGIHDVDQQRRRMQWRNEHKHCSKDIERKALGDKLIPLRRQSLLWADKS